MFGTPDLVCARVRAKVRALEDSIWNPVLTTYRPGGGWESADCLCYSFEGLFYTFYPGAKVCVYKHWRSTTAFLEYGVIPSWWSIPNQVTPNKQEIRLVS